ncbi:cytosine deaminase [Lojkania enalia]|uniref:Cytosine deaminase n=1 Tax=Lojkania enalia TaxID=147567 RepID=A0A9P4N4E8_9PLEO|nr:cytosine deaminase [Didymosphaeria enalia]
MESDLGFQAALAEAQKGSDEGGVPIGAALVSADGKVLGQGRNMRVQKGSPTLHGEISALENAGRLRAAMYRGATMYTTLSPCDMCTGACIMYGIKRVVIGENKTFLGGEAYLKQRGIEVIVLQNEKCQELMSEFIKERPGDWNEDIGQD